MSELNAADKRRLKLPRKARMRDRYDFQRVYRHGRRVDIYPLRVRCLKKRGGDESRLGLAVGKKNGNAVERNRWKRAIREAFRRHRSKLSVPCDMVFSVFWNANKEEDSLRVEKALLKIISMINSD